MAEIRDIVDRLPDQDAIKAGVEAALNLVLGKRGGTVADVVEIEAATAELVRASKAHVEAADKAFDQALEERERP